ncbi:hypothetical protein Tco_0217496, partial [Tanacetum coccineum]
MCNTAKEIWKTLLITHQGNSQVKDNKIDLLVQQYKQFVISEDESIDSAFARFNTIITSLKALDEVKAKVERKSLALKAKKESSDEECLTFGSEDEEYAMAVRDFKKFFKRRGSWSDSGEEDDENVKNKMCLVAEVSSEVCSESSYFSNENSPIEKVSTLEKNKGVDLECVKCHMLKIENEKLKEEALKLTKFEKSTHCLNEMLSNQKPSGEKLGLWFNSFEASSSGTKEIKFVKAQNKAFSDG